MVYGPHRIRPEDLSRKKNAATVTDADIREGRRIFDSYLFLPRNPDLVLVDTAVIARAPVRFLVAGLGDALVRYYCLQRSRTADET